MKTPEPQELTLAPEEPQPMQVVRREERGPMDIEHLFAIAIEAKADVGTLERMMSVRRELKAEQAKAAFDSAMAAFQAECPPIDKDRGVPDRTGKTAYKFAALDTIAIQIKPCCHKHGFSYSFDQELTCPDGQIGAICKVTHSAGHSEERRARYRLGTKTQIMSDTQQDAAAFTFACRRALQSSFGLTIKGEDVDGASGKVKPAGPSSLAPDNVELKPLARQLWELLKDVRGSAKDWKQANAWLFQHAIISDMEEAPHFSADKFKEVIAKSKIQLGVA